MVTKIEGPCGSFQRQVQRFDWIHVRWLVGSFHLIIHVGVFRISLRRRTAAALLHPGKIFFFFPPPKNHPFFYDFRMSDIIGKQDAAQVRGPRLLAGRWSTANQSQQASSVFAKSSGVPGRIDSQIGASFCHIDRDGLGVSSFTWLYAGRVACDAIGPMMATRSPASIWQA